MDKVVVIIGATGGLGSDLAKNFGANGAKVVVGGRRQAEAKKIADEINKGPGKAFAFPADVRNYEEVKALVDETVRKWGRVDILVNFAGGSLDMLTKKGDKLIVDHTDEDWNLVLDVNLKGSFHCIKAVAPQMMKQKDGHIILISSGQGIKPSRTQGSYGASKGGVNALMKAAAVELGEYNIRVNAVCPGLIIHDQMPDPGADVRAGYIGQTMLRRLSNVADFVDWVVFMAQKSNVSGQTYVLDSRALF